MRSTTWNIEGTISSTLINLCHYIPVYYEDGFISAVGDSGLIFSDEMTTIETTSIMNDVGINILQLRILFQILQYNIGAKLFEPDTIITDECGEMIAPQFGEY